MKKSIIKRIITYSILSIALVVFLFGFIDKVEQKDATNTNKIVYSIDEFSNDFKRVSTLSKRQQDIICASSRGLIEINSKGEILPSLAESVEVTDNGIQYNFKIRNDIFWSDGNKITTSEIIEFFRQIILEEDENEISALLNVYGAKNYRSGTGAFSKQVAIQGKDDRLIIRLNNKDDNFLTEISKPQYRLRENILLWDDIKLNHQSIRYSGNYKIKSIENLAITLTKNDKITKDIAKEIVFVKDESEEVAMAALEVGNRDIVINPPRSQLQRLKGEKRLITMESDRGMYIAYNQNTTLSLSARKEIYRKIIKAMEDYTANNSNLLVMSEGSYFRKDKDDLDKLQARKVFINTQEEWDEKKIIKVLAEENTQNKEVCLFISNWFKDNTNQTIVYELLNREKLKNASKQDKYDILLLENYNNPNRDNSFYIQVEELLSKDILKEINKQNIKQELVRVEETLFDNFLILPLVFFNDNIAITDEIKNVSLDGNGNIIF